MAELTVLSMTDRVHIDSRRLGEIVDELGETAAHTVLTLALEQLAQGLD